MAKSKVAYLAGLFDGEGNIIIMKSHKEKLNPGYSLRVALSNSSVVLMSMVEQFREVFNFSINYHPFIDGHKHVYELRAYGANAAVMLKTILPYLIIKREEAGIALEFYEKYGDGRGRRADSSRKELAESYRHWLQELKGNGKNRIKQETYCRRN